MRRGWETSDDGSLKRDLVAEIVSRGSGKSIRGYVTICACVYVCTKLGRFQFNLLGGLYASFHENSSGTEKKRDDW